MESNSKKRKLEEDRESAKPSKRSKGIPKKESGRQNKEMVDKQVNLLKAGIQIETDVL